jgi:hypothetical protein
MQKFTKQDLYGQKTVEKIWNDVELLQNLSITRDGINILPNGAIASQYCDVDGNYIPRTDVVNTDGEGKVLEKQPSMFSQENRLDIIEFEDLFRYDIIRAHILEISENFDELYSKCQSLFAEDKLYKFCYAYRATTDVHDAILLPHDNQIFLLVGDYAALRWTSSEIDLDHLQTMAEDGKSLKFEESW